MNGQLAALRAVFGNPQLRRLELAWMATSLGVWGGALALSVEAYQRGGPAAVGLIALLRALPSAPAAPLLAVVVDRSSRRRVMIVASAVRAAIMFGIAAVVAADAPIGAMYALVMLLALAGPAFRPAFTALVPRAARTPAELASANVAGSIVYNGGFLLGSLLAGVLLGATSAAAVFAIIGGAFLVAVVPLLGVPRDAAPDADPDERPLAQLTAGFKTVRADAGVRELVLITSSLFFVDGALDVLIVVAALGFLDVGEAGAGVLTSVWGLGCVAGSAGVMVLLSRGRLTSGIMIGALVFGAAIALVGVVGALAIAVLGLVTFGIGYTLVEVAAATLLQRVTPDHLLGRVAGVAEATTVTAMAFGSLAGGLLADWIGARAAFVVVGALVPALVLLRRRRLARLEAGAPVAEREYQLLRAHEIFAPLPVAETERLANALTEMRPADGEDVITEGDAGDCFYLIAEGELDVFMGGIHQDTRVKGEGVGEIALIRDVPRTATVRARPGAVLLALDRTTFLEAVASQPPSGRAAHRIADERVPRVTG